jgi:serum/glucocorticoid-regulated kinase 2
MGQRKIVKEKEKEKESPNPTIVKTSFNFHYVIGIGGFGKVWKVDHKNKSK